MNNTKLNAIEFSSSFINDVDDTLIHNELLFYLFVFKLMCQLFVFFSGIETIYL